MTEKEPDEFLLSTVSTDELLDEILKRYDVCAFIGFQQTENNPPELGMFGDVTERYYGPAFSVLGLLTWAQQLKFDGIRVPVDKDDESDA